MHRIVAAACALLFGLAGPAGAQQNTLKIGGTGSTLSTMRVLAAAFEQDNPGVTVRVLSSLGSTGGIKATVAGAIDVGVSSRALTDAERGQGARAVEYGRTPLVFVVNRATRASDLTTAQVVDIYAGKMTAWPSGDPIRVVLRPAGDTNTIILKALSAQVREAVLAAEKRPGMITALTDQDAEERIQKVPGALIVTSLSEALNSPSLMLVLKFNGVEPSASALAGGSYPLSLSFFLVTGKSPSPLAAKFVDFVRSETGRKILAETGHAPPKP
jgi:phosphate transport system substrate-binding protein